MIGLLGRLDVTPSLKDAYIIYKSLNDVLINYDMEVIGIMPNKLDKVTKIIDMCDGIILSGGSNELEEDYSIIKYIYDNNIPCLGICMGMQEMAYVYGGIIDDVSNHHSNNVYCHDVITMNSKIYGDKIIGVNSRHRSKVLNTTLEVTGKSEDGVIEMIEDKKKKFFVGVEWHPENMWEFDENAKILFDKFIESTKK